MTVGLGSRRARHQWRCLRHVSERYKSNAYDERECIGKIELFLGMFCRECRGPALGAVKSIMRTEEKSDATDRRRQIGKTGAWMRLRDQENKPTAQAANSGKSFPSCFHHGKEEGARCGGQAHRTEGKSTQHI